MNSATKHFSVAYFEGGKRTTSLGLKGNQNGDFAMQWLYIGEAKLLHFSQLSNAQTPALPNVQTFAAFAIVLQNVHFIIFLKIIIINDLK
jgi:hypothetical protein